MEARAVTAAQVHAQRDLLRDAFDDRELVEVNGRRFIINPLTEQIPATSAELLMAAARGLWDAGEFGDACKVVGEEDKGGILVAAVSLISGLPFGLSRWYPSGVEGQVSIDFESEYAGGRLYLNGVEPGDKVVIVDDLISTGGTMIAMVQAIRSAGAKVIDIICVAAKVEYAGCQRVKEVTGCHVKTLVSVAISGSRSRVLSVYW